MKKGQSGGDIAVFIFLLAIFMVIYVLMVPPEVREELLDINQEPLYNTSDDILISGVKDTVLLNEEPGVVKPFDKGKVIHEMNDVALYIKNEPKTSDLAYRLEVSNGLFGEKTQDLSFSIDDLPDVKRVMIYMTVLEGKGNFVVELNGKEIYDNEVGPGIESIVLPINLLGEYNNVKLKVSNKIFGKNVYKLSNVKLRETYELENTQEERSIIVGEHENGNGKLEYHVYCNSAERSAMFRIYLNDKEINQQILPCVSTLQNVEIDEDDLQEGENIFKFEIDKGDFLFSNIGLSVDSEEGGALKYEFPITSKEYDKLVAEQAEISFKMELVDDGKATIDINGNLLNLDGDSYSRYISRFIEKGNNYVKIIPKNEFEIKNIEILLEEV